MKTSTRRRSTTRQANSGPEISIPAKLHFFTFIFLSVWLVIWVATELFGLRTLLPAQEPYLVLWLIGWTLGGLFILYIWLWMIAGKEIVTVRSGVLSITRTLFGYARVREYDLLHVSNLRVDPEPYDSEGPRLSAVYPFRTGPIAFEYGGKTVRFADGVSQTEAHEIVTLLNSGPLATRKDVLLNS